MINEIDTLIAEGLVHEFKRFLETNNALWNFSKKLIVFEGLKNLDDFCSVLLKSKKFDIYSPFLSIFNCFADDNDIKYWWKLHDDWTEHLKNIKEISIRRT